MNISKTIFGTFILSLFLFSCGTSNNDASHNESEAEVHDGHLHDAKTATIELNNGEKWKVNAEMVPFVQDGEKLLTDFDDKDYVRMAAQLKEKNNDLIKSCTMDGKSHDELHKWLHPHLELVEKLGSAENEHEADEVLDKLKASFQTYHTYFQ